MLSLLIEYFIVFTKITSFHGLLYYTSVGYMLDSCFVDNFWGLLQLDSKPLPSPLCIDFAGHVKHILEDSVQEFEFLSLNMKGLKNLVFAQFWLLHI